MGLDPGVGHRPGGVHALADHRQGDATASIATGIRSQAPGLRMLTKGTSGSTGEPFAIDYDEGSLAAPDGRGVSRLHVGRRASRGEAVLFLG